MKRKLIIESVDLKKSDLYSKDYGYVDWYMRNWGVMAFKRAYIWLP